MTTFDWIEKAPVDAVFGVDAAFKADSDSRKVNLGVGAYRDDAGRPQMFKAVRRAGLSCYDEGENKEYLPMGGLPDAARLQQRLAFGTTSLSVVENRIASVQTMSGTGALAVLGTFFRRYLPKLTYCYLSNPTWANHESVFTSCGFTCRTYPYWKPSTKGLDFDGYLHAVLAAPKRSLFVVHPVAHNPTGCDPSEDQWRALLSAFKEQEHVVLLDCAYQGFASGDLEKDAFAIRLFADEYPYTFAVAQSFAKNMGLYGERCGACHMRCLSFDEANRVEGVLKRVCRVLWSNPAKHGQEICYKILRDAELYDQWEKELKEVSGRIIAMRTALRDGLVTRKTPGNWDHIVSQVGMFSYLGLTQEQVKRIVQEWHVYMMNSSRISLAGVNSSNVDYICDAIHDVVTKLPASQS